MQTYLWYGVDDAAHPGAGEHVPATLPRVFHAQRMEDGKVPATHPCTDARKYHYRCMYIECLAFGRTGRALTKRIALSGTSRPQSLRTGALIIIAQYTSIYVYWMHLRFPRELEALRATRYV